MVSTNGQVNGNGVRKNVGRNGVSTFVEGRLHPQSSFAETAIEPSSFFGQLRALYSGTVLKTQLEQMRKSGAYDGFTLRWHPSYEINRISGGCQNPAGNPPLIFQECDISTWAEAVAYFLDSPDGKQSPHRAELEACLEETVDRIEKAQQDDGYLGIYFTVVDPKGRFMNLRDMHEMYEAGHLIEAALAHHQLTDSRKFLDTMIRYVALLQKTFGPHSDQLHGYPGHPELELAMIRLYGVTNDPSHLEFAQYLLEERGQKRKDQGDMTYFDWEAKERRKNLVFIHSRSTWNDQVYCQAHLPIHDQETILGHSVRALYLITAAADMGGQFLDDAKRLLSDAIDNKMYVTGGVGSVPKTEGFSEYAHNLPHSSAEGGGYNETCASIAVMMVCERILSHGLDGKLRDTMELCLFNNVLGGGSLDGRAFAYENQLATCGHESTIRKPWFETACCPPNLARTLGMIGGYTWSTQIDPTAKRIHLKVYLYISGTRTIPLPNGQIATVNMQTSMPWKGNTRWKFDAPPGWCWSVDLPSPQYAENIHVGPGSTSRGNGFIHVDVASSAELSQTFDLPVRLLANHPQTGQDVLTVSRGPLIYTAEAIDNDSIEKEFPHFEGICLSSSSTFREREIEVLGFKIIQLVSEDRVFGIEGIKESPSYRVVNRERPARTWKSLDENLVFTPWFARGNRGGNGHIRTSMIRKD